VMLHQVSTSPSHKPRCILICLHAVTQTQTHVGHRRMAPRVKNVLHAVGLHHRYPGDPSKGCAYGGRAWGWD
jgi:hypothetical protein